LRFFAGGRLLLGALARKEWLIVKRLARHEVPLQRILLQPFFDCLRIPGDLPVLVPSKGPLTSSNPTLSATPEAGVHATRKRKLNFAHLFPDEDCDDDGRSDSGEADDVAEDLEPAERLRLLSAPPPPSSSELGLKSASSLSEAPSKRRPPAKKRKLMIAGSPN